VVDVVIEHRPSKLPFVVLIVACLATIVVVPMIGAGHVGWVDVRTGLSESGTVGGQIFWRVRVPRLLLGILAGSALAAAGVAFQSMFRNPLASPFTLGVASGAGLGAALAMSLAGTWAILGTGWAVSAAAFAGAMGSVLIVYGLAGVRRGFSSNTLLLAGVSIGFVCSAMILLIQYLSSQAVTNATIRWLMGSVDPLTGYAAFKYSLPLVLVGLALLAWHWREMDLLMMGDLVAAGRGVNVRRSRRWIYFSASVMVAAVVAQTGPIAFVGLVVPHMVRMAVGPTHGRLLPAALLGGAIFLPVCDVVAANGMRWMTHSATAAGQLSALSIPVGVLTSLIGGIFFLAMLLGRRSEAPIL
jgi:iron complex transport system permease protein